MVTATSLLRSARQLFRPVSSGLNLRQRATVTSLSDYDFHLPEELIAQVPAEPRDSSRLMVVDRSSGSIEHRVFRELPQILSAQHMVVMNNTRVVNCKLAAMSSTGQPVVVYLLDQLGPTLWEISGNEAFESLPAGSRFTVDGTDLVGTVTKVDDGEGAAQATFSSATAAAAADDLRAKLQTAATVPLPPYITAVEGEAGYQTVYAKEDGSVAAPTAGLHFTEAVFDGLAHKGIPRLELTLHVGYGTFGHVHHEDLRQHKMHSEKFSMPPQVASRINSHRSGGGQVLAVGTTSTRVLESCSTEDGVITPRSGETDIFIHPGYRFKAVDSLLTNFHMPRLTPIMLVAAFAGHDLTMKAYKEAVDKRYRFFSFGDSMLIL